MPGGGSLDDAIDNANPGDVFELQPGTYNPIRLDSVNGTASRPVVLTAANPNNEPVFTVRSYSRQAGIHVTRSSHLQISDIDVRFSLWGIYIEGSNNVVLDAVDIADTGQEAVRVRSAFANGNQVESSRITIQNSRIGNTGNRPGGNFDLFGEGIYLGDGTSEAEEVQYVTITGNEIYDTSTEAIDVKWPSRDVVIENNTIRDVNTGTSGAVAVHVNKTRSMTNSGVVIRGNTIRGITTRTRYQDGNGILAGSNLVASNNTFRDIQHFDIRIDSPAGTTLSPTLSGNSYSKAESSAIGRFSG